MPVIGLGGDAQRRQGMGIEVGRLEGSARRDVRESDERVHERELPGVVELETWEALAGREHRGFRETPQLAAVHKGLEDVLLDVEIPIDDAGQLAVQGGQVFDRFANPVEVVDAGLQLARVVRGHPAAEDGRDAVGLADRAVGIEQPGSPLIERRAPLEDQVVAVLGLREEEPMLTAGLTTFLGREERRERAEPLLAARHQVVRGETIGERLEAVGVAALEERVSALPKGDPFFSEPVGQPVMLVQADARREREVRTHAHTQAAPALVVEVDVAVRHPPLGELEVPPVVGRRADSRHDPSGLARLQDDHDFVGFGASEEPVDELIASSVGLGQDRNAPFASPRFDPGMVLVGDVAQQLPRNRVLVPVAREEPDHTFGLLERLNQSVQQQPIETAVAEPDAILVVLAEGVHGDLRDVRHLRGYPPGRLREDASMRDYHQLDLWQRAMTYTVQIYEFTAQLPETERYNLTAQLRRAATSVPLNIAEGSGCSTDAEFARFVGHAYRSLKQVVTGLELCQRLYGSLPVPPMTALIDEGNQISRMAHSFMQRLGTSTGSSPS